jgi:hypothetical protein
LRCEIHVEILDNVNEEDEYKVKNLHHLPSAN